MKIHVIDASVAIKWFVNEEQGKITALEVLEQIKGSPRNFAVPELFFYEMLAVLTKLLKNPTAVKEFLNILQNLGMERVGNGRVLLETATEIAVTHKLTGYDAIYAACAKLIHGTWITFDQQAAKKVKEPHLVQLLSSEP